MSIALEVDPNVAAGAPIRALLRTTGVSRARVFVRRTTISRTAAFLVLTTKHIDEPVRMLSIQGPERQLELPALRGPLTYVGTRVELVWSVVAEALANDGKVADSTEMPITLGRPTAITIEREVVGGYRDQPTETTVLEPVFGEEHVEGPRTGDVVGPDAANPFFILGSVIARAFTRLSRNDVGIRNLELTATPMRVRAGESVIARVAFDVDSPLVIEGVTIELIAQEVHAGGRHMPVLHTREERGRGRERIEPGLQECEARFDIPAGAVPSFATANIGVEWFLRATIPVDGHEDVVRELVLTVAPF